MVMMNKNNKFFFVPSILFCGSDIDQCNAEDHEVGETNDCQKSACVISWPGVTTRSVGFTVRLLTFRMFLQSVAEQQCRFVVADAALACDQIGAQTCLVGHAAWNFDVTSLVSNIAGGQRMTLELLVATASGEFGATIGDNGLLFGRQIIVR